MATSVGRLIRLNLYSILLTIIFYPVFFLSLVAFTPIYLFGFLATFVLRPLLRPDLGKLVTTRSAVIAGTDNPSKDPNWVLCVWLVLEGQLDFTQFRKNFFQNIVLKRTPSGTLYSPEYQQYFEQWLGFMFWKWEENFNVCDHIRHLIPESEAKKSKSVTREDLRHIIKELSWKPFPAGKSPWEFLFVPRFQDEEYCSSYKCQTGSGNKSVLIFRVHHGFCDGFAILHLLMQEVNGVSLTSVAKPEVNLQKENILLRGLKNSLFWITAPFVSMKMLVWAVDTNDWHLKRDQLSKPRNLGFGPRIPLEYIKLIKNLHGVSFSAVVYASLTGALRQMMIIMGKSVPERMSTLVPVPMPGHPYKLRNHFIFSFLQLPTGVEDPLERLKKMERNINALKGSLAPLLNFFMVPLVGATFSWIMKLFSVNAYSTVLSSNFPGPPEIINFIGGGGSHRITDMNFAVGLGDGGVGIGFCMMSYDGDMRIISSFDQSILATDNLVDLFNEKIIQEMEILRCRTGTTCSV